MTHNSSPDLHSPDSPAPYSLIRDLGVWRLTFGGKLVLLSDEKPVHYLAVLLRHPGEPFQALQLAAAVEQLLGRPSGSSAMNLVYQRSQRFEDRERHAMLDRKIRELHATLEDEDEIEPVKAEATRELEALIKMCNSQMLRTRDQAHLLHDAVRKCLRRFHQRLARATDARGWPHPVLREFGAHLDVHLLQASRQRSLSGRRGGSGHYIYNPPEQVQWIVA